MKRSSEAKAILRARASMKRELACNEFARAERFRKRMSASDKPFSPGDVVSRAKHFTADNPKGNEE